MIGSVAGTDLYPYKPVWCVCKQSLKEGNKWNSDGISRRDRLSASLQQIMFGKERPRKALYKASVLPFSDEEDSNSV